MFFRFLIVSFLLSSTIFASNLLNAIKAGDVIEVKSEIENGVDLDEKFDVIQVDEETTPLMLASYYGYFDIVELLVKSGADVLARNSILDSALTIAQEQGYNDIVDYLIPYFRDIKYDFFGASESVEWADSLEDAIDMAKEDSNSDKLVMAVFMRIGCKWSQKMGEGDFQDEGIVNIINKSFIPVLMDKEIGEYPRDIFKVKFTPTIFFLDSQMNIKSKIGGFRAPEKFIKELKVVNERLKRRE